MKQSDSMDLQNEEIFSTKLELNVIDYFCTFNYLLSYAGIEFPSETATCYCPFHENTNTKAAKHFSEEHNDHVFCFAEGKLYRPHHLLTTGIVDFSVNHVFSAIWANLSDDEKSIFSEDLRSHIVEVDFSQHYNNYKKCKLKYFDLLNILRNS
jgi:hypothetical protein